MNVSEIRHRVEKLSEVELKLLVAKLNNLTVQPEKEIISGNKQVIAYITPKDDYDAEELKSYLKKNLPDYMIPSFIHPVMEIPKLPNGKIDRNALSAFSEISTNESSLVPPKSDLEKQLVALWEEVLQVSPIGVNDNFFELGGDSILSIQLISKARKLGVNFSPNQLFENPTIDGISQGIQNSKSQPLATEEIITGNIRMSPIQHWFFDTHKLAPHFWNQAWQLQGFDFINKSSVQTAVEALIKHHDALRLTFSRVKGNWNATLLHPNDVKSLFFIEISHDELHLKESIIKKHLKNLQEGTSLEKGPNFRCIYFHTGHTITDTIVLLAHHLVVDVVSWNIIIEQFLSTAKNSSAHQTQLLKNIRTTSIKDWGDYLKKLVSENLLENQLAYWNDQVAKATHLPVDSKNEDLYYEEHTATETLKLNKEQTLVLLTELNIVYKTKTEELILAALVDTIKEWSNLEQISIALERNGRVTEKTQMDLSNTVGWFTAFYPLSFASIPSKTVRDKINQIKEILRSVPDGGIGFGVLKYMMRAIESDHFPEIIFNYLGNQGQSKTGIEFIETGLRDTKSENPYFFEINAGVLDGELYLNWTYNTKRHKTETVIELLAIMKQNLNDIIQSEGNSNNQTYHTTDFPEAELSQDDLDKLLGSFQ